MKISKRTLIWVILIVPYFEFQSLDLLVSEGIMPNVFHVITNAFSLGRTAISTYLLLYSIKQRFKNVRVISLGILMFVFIRALMCFLNGSFDKSLVLGYYNFFGFALLISFMLETSINKTNDAIVVFFGTVCVASVLTALIYPMGFNKSSDVSNAIFLFGHKNIFFFYCIPYLYSYLAKSLTDKKVFKYQSILICVVLLFGTYLFDSKTTMVILIGILGYIIADMIGIELSLILNKRIFFLAGILFIFIIFGSEFGFLEYFFKLIGRDATFTGRDVLWTQAIKMIIRHPFVGNGYQQKFILISGSVAMPHAHCFYLDEIAKYGVFSLLVIIGLVGAVIRQYFKDSNKKMVMLKTCFLFVLLVHNITEDIDIYTMILMLGLFSSFKHSAKERLYG